MLWDQIQNLTEGYSAVMYNHKKYSVVKETFNNQQSFKIFAKELGGKNFIILNYYKMSDKHVLKPCVLLFFWPIGWADYYGAWLCIIWTMK